MFRVSECTRFSVQSRAGDASKSIRGRLAFTLVELLVVIAIIGVLVGLLLPAIQAARGAAARMQCANHLKQLGLGMHNFHAAHDSFPTTVSGTSSISGTRATHYWVAQVLPFMEQTPLAETYDYTVRFDDVANREAVGTAIPFMICPSTPMSPIPDPRFKRSTRTSPGAWGSIGADYAGSAGPLSSLWNAPNYAGYPEPGSTDGFFNGTTDPGVKGRRSRDILDGLSNSIMFVESAGRPQVWQGGRQLPGSGGLDSGGLEYVAVSGWASANLFVVRGYRYDESIADEWRRWRAPGPKMVNASNFFSVYSFHVGGAMVGLADGSVKFVTESVDTATMCKALTIAGHEVGEAF